MIGLSLKVTCLQNLEITVESPLKELRENLLKLVI